MGVLPMHCSFLYSTPPFSHRKTQQAATGSNSLRRLVYCRPDAGQNRMPRAERALIWERISASSVFLPYCSSVPSMSLQMSLMLVGVMGIMDLLAV